MLQSYAIDEMQMYYTRLLIGGGGRVEGRGCPFISLSCFLSNLPISLFFYHSVGGGQTPSAVVVLWFNKCKTEAVDWKGEGFAGVITYFYVPIPSPHLFLLRQSNKGHVPPRPRDNASGLTCEQPFGYRLPLEHA